MVDNSDKQPAVHYYLLRYQFPIVGFDESSGKEVVVGTCVLLQAEDRVFLITAAHVMNERHRVKNCELWICNYSDGSKITINEDIIGNPGNGEGIPHWNDVALVELNIEEYESFNNSDFFKECFLHLHRVIPDVYYQKQDGEENAYVIAGYASSQNKIIRNRYKKPKITLFGTSETQDSAVQPTSIDTALTISLLWDNDALDTKGVSLPAPQGMSGGGVWMLSNKSDFNPRLHAISVAYSRKEKKVIAVKMSLVLSMLKKFFDLKLDGVDISILLFETDDGKLTVLVPEKGDQ